jgi:UDP-N-acetylglucosamine acyltransferase
MIHPTAIIDSKAKIDHGVTIGPYSIIKENTTILKGTTIGSHVVIEENVTIDNDCEIFQFASIGGAPQDLKFEGEISYLKIGKGTVIREFATVNKGTGLGGGVTELGKNNFLMAYSHVAHDCKTGDNVILANNATLAGHVTVGNYATIGGMVGVHQFVKIGDYAFIGGKSAIVKDVPPYVIAVGDRAKLHGLNNVGLGRHKFSDETILCLKKAYKTVFRTGLTLNEAIDKAKKDSSCAEVEIFLNFIESSGRGITR